MDSKLKLYVELVPETCWYENLRKVLPRNEWDIIRKDAYLRAGYKCEICGSTGKLNCHEIWNYNDIKNIQSLKGFQALCDNCHNIKHMGFVNIQISKGIWPESVFVNLTEHFMRVNNVVLEDFKRHLNEAFDIWRNRSKKEWKTDLGPFAEKSKTKNLTDFIGSSSG